MGKNNLSHKIIVALIFIVIASVVFYSFYLNSKDQESDKSAYLSANIENEPIKNFEIREKPEGRFIVNDQARFMLAIPMGWNIEMVNEDNEIELLSPNMIGERGFFPSKGCAIRVGISHFIQTFPDQERRPQDIKKKMVGDSPLLEGAQKIITIDNRSALKTLQFKDHDRGRIILIELPIENTIYHFGIIYSLTNEDECLKSFDQVIDSVSID